MVHITQKKTTEDSLGCKFIPVDIANQMIGSYLSSVSGSSDAVKSFSLDADSLRAYLSDPSIKNIKLVFAHTQAYMAAGNTGVNAGYQSGALTIVIACYDSLGNYIYHNGSVLDHVLPCPASCPPGNAGNSLLQ